MNIRKCFLVAAAVLSIAAISSCKKEGMPFFRGTYAFVTSGTISCADMDEGGSPESLEFQLASERGIMRIEGDGNGDILTMTTVAGEALVFDVNINGANISLGPQKRMVNAIVDSRSVSIPVTVEGWGHKTGNIIVLELDYSGEFSYASSHSYRIRSSRVKCVATAEE